MGQIYRKKTDKLSCLKQAVDRYRLRYAAGVFWLFDDKQDGSDYQPPLELNATAAKLYCWYRQGKTMDEMSKELSKQYGIDIREATEDVNNVFKRINDYL